MTDGQIIAAAIHNLSTCIIVAAIVIGGMIGARK